MSAAHFELSDLADHQLELAAAGRWDDLVVAMEDFSHLAGSLPAAAPASALAALERLEETQRLLRARLDDARAGAARELGSLQRGRGAVRGYQVAALEPGGQIDGAA